MEAKTLFIFGYGYAAAALAKELRGQGWGISGTARDADKRTACTALGIRLVDFADTAGVEAALAEATHVLCFIPPAQAGGDPALKHYRALVQQAPNLRWLGYASTTGVYGDAKGEWVDEETPPNPENLRARLRRDAEQAWAKIGYQRRIPSAVFRIAGIYGPGRSALDSLKRGEARRIDKLGHFFSRIHVEDIAGIVGAAMAKDAGGIFNLADEYPSAARDVVEYATDLSGLPLPPLEPFEGVELSPMSREFYAASRRVKAARAASVLGYRFRYPSFREGLRAQWEAMGYQEKQQTPTSPHSALDAES